VKVAQSNSTGLVVKYNVKKRQEGVAVNEEGKVKIYEAVVVGAVRCSWLPREVDVQASLVTQLRS
jgi:hypothetical protein